MCTNMTFRWIFYSAVNSVTPQIILNLGFENNSWDIAVRQLSYKLPSLFFSLPITWYATKFKDMSECKSVFLMRSALLTALS